MSNYLTVDELETDMHKGLKVAWVGEDGDALAFTDDLPGGEAAILAMARCDLGGRCATVEPSRLLWMRFRTPEGYSSDEWQGQPCAETDEGAVRVVRAVGVYSLREAMLAERARLMRVHPEVTAAADFAPLMGEHEGEYWDWCLERAAAADGAGT